VRVNHLIIGVANLNESREFFVGVLGFKSIGEFVDTGTGGTGLVLVHCDSRDQETLEILLVPFAAARLPSPQHLALEVSAELFETVFSTAKKNGLPIRAVPPLDSKETGIIGRFECRGVVYERFYLLDPSRVNIEIMYRR